MPSAYFEFDRSVADFLPSARHPRAFTHAFEGAPAVKDTLEALGVPHTEIEAIRVNGRPVGFGYALRDGDRVQVYGAESAALDSALRAPLPRPARFVLDTHLGKLAGYLRMLGFDTLYRNDYVDEELARVSGEQARILLTRDLGVLKRSAVVYGYYVRETDPRGQLVEVLQRFTLLDEIVPFRRCLRCNGVLEAVDKAQIAARLPADALAYYHDFRICRACDQIYWPGSHYQHMRAFVDAVMDAVTRRQPRDAAHHEGE